MKKLTLLLLAVLLCATVASAETVGWVVNEEDGLVCPSHTLCYQRLNSCLNNALANSSGAELEAAAARCYEQLDACTSTAWCLPVY